MKILWADEAWEDYLWWERNNKKIREKINTLVTDIEMRTFTGLGKPEPLRKKWSGYWSRRITKEHRLVYKFEKGTLYIAQCRYHY